MSGMSDGILSGVSMGKSVKFIFVLDGMKFSSYKLLTLSLRLSPPTLQRKLISAACIHDIILLVTTQSS